MTTVLTNTNTDALLKIAQGDLEVLEEFALDWKKSLSRCSENSNDQNMVQNSTSK